MTAAGNSASVPSAAGTAAPVAPALRAPEQLPGGVFTGPGSPRRWLARHRRVGPLRSRPRTAFVFAGGGARGAAQIGMLEALMARGITARRRLRGFGGRHQRRGFRRHAQRGRGGDEWRRSGVV